MIPRFWGKAETPTCWRGRSDQVWDETGLPDSYNPQGLCARCGRQSNFEVGQSADLSFDGAILERDGTKRRTASERITPLICRGCSHGIAVVEEQCLLSVRPGSGQVVWRACFAWPLANARISSDVPADIAAVYGEAVVALSAQIPRAAATMARATLDAITMDKGDKSIKNLAQRLNDMAARGILQPSLAEWSHEVRLVGNDAVHDAAVPVSLPDAKQLIDFIGELFKYLYEMPADLQRKRGSN